MKKAHKNKKPKQQQTQQTVPEQLRGRYFAALHCRMPPAQAFKNPNEEVEVKEATDEETKTSVYCRYWLWMCGWATCAHTTSLSPSRSLSLSDCCDQTAEQSKQIIERESFRLLYLACFCRRAFKTLSIGQERLTSADTERSKTQFMGVFVCVKALNTHTRIVQSVIIKIKHKNYFYCRFVHARNADRMKNERQCKACKSK